MKNCFASDLHIDMSGQPSSIKWPKADVLCIAGDTANDYVYTKLFLNDLASKGIYDYIMTLDGNHEHYMNGMSKETVGEAVAEMSKDLAPNVIFLPAHSSFQVGDYHYIGRNGWYSFDYAADPDYNKSVWPDEVNDCRRIGFDVMLQTPAWELAKQHADEIRAEIERLVLLHTNPKIIVMTHTVPHRKMLKDDVSYLTTNSFFLNSHMQRVIEDLGSHISIWHHGHTHYPKDAYVDDTYIICNPRGRASENPNWEPVVI